MELWAEHDRIVFLVKFISLSGSHVVEKEDGQNTSEKYLIIKAAASVAAR